MAFEWVAGLFQGDNQQARGLSRDQSNSVALDSANSFYNYRLKRHSTDGDLIVDPSLLWYTSPYVKRRSGLGTHVGAEVGDGTANYTDVLVIVSRDEWPRASVEWQTSATITLQREFEQFCRRENFARLHAHRPLGVRIVEDGGQAMQGQTLGLTRGEFVTGLLPNMYTGPVRGSYPVIGVHLNLPGVWEGYREVGRMYNDQILFTVGSHWLDNFHHPSLQQAALYRLRQYSDGSFLHIVNPDLQDQYQVTSTNQGGGASVLTLATRTGHPLAYMVLAVIDPPRSPPPGSGSSYGQSTPVPAAGGWANGARSVPPQAPPRRPGIQMPSPAGSADGSSRGDMRGDSPPSIAPPMMLDEGRPTTGSMGGKTIIPDAPSERLFTLQERGALLQKVHFAAFMLGYDVYLGQRGELGTHVEDPAATFQVRKRSVHLVAHVHNVSVDGRPAPAGVEVPIEGDVVIEVAGQKLDYRDLRACTAEGWPYVGEIRRPASSTYMVWGEEYHIGRSRECRVVLPDEPRNENIHWKPAIGDGATIRARSGEIPKARFYTDSIMVASEHAAVQLVGDHPRVVCTARHCYVYIRRGSEIFALRPATADQGGKEMDLESGDEVLIGNCLFHVSYHAGDLAVPAPAPIVELQSRAPNGGARPRPTTAADRLVADVAAPNLSALDRDTGPPAPTRAATPSLGSPIDPHTTGHSFGRDIDGASHRSLSPADLPSRELPPPATRRGPVMDSILGSTSVAPEDAPTTPRTPPGAPSSTGDVVREPTAQPADARGWDAPPSNGRATDPSHGEGRAPGSSAPIDLRGIQADPFLSPNATDPRLRAAPTVAAVDDAEAQLDLGRPLHLVLVGWAVNGEGVCGNHTGADMVLPESRVRRDQTFKVRDYFRIRVRGRKGSVDILDRDEVEVDGARPNSSYDDPDPHRFGVIRRDDAGERDYAIALRLTDDPGLPDPRARFLAIGHEPPSAEDRLAAPLVTRGLPKGAPRTLRLGELVVTFNYDGTVVRVSDYLESYRRGTGFIPFLVQHGSERFRTAPEDGAPFDAHPGDRLIVGSAVYVIRSA